MFICSYIRMYTCVCTAYICMYLHIYCIYTHVIQQRFGVQNPLKITRIMYIDPTGDDDIIGIIIGAVLGGVGGVGGATGIVVFVIWLKKRPKISRQSKEHMCTIC